jgi:hypothetical protein
MSTCAGNIQYSNLHTGSSPVKYVCVQSGEFPCKTPVVKSLENERKERKKYDSDVATGVNYGDA